MDRDWRFDRFLDDLVDELFDEAYKTMGWSELARAAGLCYQTVARLGNRVTRNPQLRTIYKLARAVGMEVSVAKRVKAFRRKAA